MQNRAVFNHINLFEAFGNYLGNYFGDNNELLNIFLFSTVAKIALEGEISPQTLFLGGWAVMEFAFKNMEEMPNDYILDNHLYM